MLNECFLFVKRVCVFKFLTKKNFYIFLLAVTFFGTAICMQSNPDENFISDFVKDFVEKVETLKKEYPSVKCFLITTDNVEELHKMVKVLTENMGVYLPAVGVNLSVEALATKYNNKINQIVIGYELIKILTKDELQWVIAHELAHIKLGHYQEIKVAEWCNIPLLLPFLCFCEKEADLVSIKYIDNPDAAAGAIGKLCEHKYGENKINFLKINSSKIHPSYATRIKYLKKEARRIEKHRNNNDN